MIPVMPAVAATGERAEEEQPEIQIPLHSQNCLSHKYILSKDRVSATDSVRNTRTNCETFTENLAKKVGFGRRPFVQSTEK